MNEQMIITQIGHRNVEDTNAKNKISKCTLENSN
jgi:hypothetical protein